VTGTFDNWGKTIKLDKVGTAHEKTVPLESHEKILYKVRRRMGKAGRGCARQLLTITWSAHADIEA